MAARFSGPGESYEGVADKSRSGSKWTGEIEFVDHMLDLPLRWKRPRMIFVNSMSDLFHENVEDLWIYRIFAIMAMAPQHTFQVLTKRPKRMLKFMSDSLRCQDVVQQLCAMVGPEQSSKMWEPLPWPLPNVWLGVSVEDQKTADERTRHLHSQ